MASILSVGAILGALVVGPLSDLLGRKFGIYISGLSYLLGSLLCGLSSSVAALEVGRAVVGAGTGSAMMVVPVYLAESAPPEIRGRMSIAFTTLAIAGNLLASIACAALGSDWKAMLLSGAVPALLQLGGMAFMPESPLWLIKVGRTPQARAILLRVRHPQCQEEQAQINEYVESVEQFLLSQGSLSLCQQLRLLVSKYRRNLLVGTMLLVIYQFTGLMAYVYFSSTILLPAHPPSHSRV